MISTVLNWRVNSRFSLQKLILSLCLWLWLSFRWHLCRPCLFIAVIFCCCNSFSALPVSHLCCSETFTSRQQMLVRWLWHMIRCCLLNCESWQKLKKYSEMSVTVSYSGFSVSSFTSKTHLQLQWNIFITPVRQAVNLQMLCLAYKTTHTKIHKLLWMYSTDVAVLAVSYSYINLFFFHCCFSSDSFLMFNVCRTTDKLLTSYE